MANSLDILFGPLSKNYCLYFYIISVFGLVSLFFLCISTLYIGITKKKGTVFYMQMIYTGILYFMIYLTSRLLFTMCNHSL
jgi:hypothetical protein